MFTCILIVVLFLISELINTQINCHCIYDIVSRGQAGDDHAPEDAMAHFLPFTHNLFFYVHAWLAHL